jgi:pilus assembly protein CpaC
MIANWSTNPNFRYISPGAPEGAKLLPIGGSGWRPFIGLTTSINSMINLSVNNGDAYILATPELSARSGGKAEFLAGGQVPIVMPATAGAPPSVTFKDYGITLKVEPVTDANNNVTTVIKTEMSSIDNSVSVNGNPGFLTRKTDTEFNVQSGQTIVLSGLVNTDIQKDNSKVAGIGDLPILGELFKSKNFRSGRTDLVIFVTPTVLDPSTNMSDERLKKARDIEDKFNSISSDQGILK